MSGVLTSLGAWGCDVKGAMERMGDDESFYLECLHDITEDPYFASLKTAMDAGNISGAFDAAHTLKGVLANVGLTPMYHKVAEIVEPLRAGSREDLSEQYDQLIKMKTHLEDILAEG